MLHTLTVGSNHIFFYAKGAPREHYYLYTYLVWNLFLLWHKKMTLLQQVARRREFFTVYFPSLLPMKPRKATRTTTYTKRNFVKSTNDPPLPPPHLARYLSQKTT